MHPHSPALLTRHGRFLDREGRQVILHGVNLVNKDPGVGYLGPEGPETFANFRRWGFNCIRLGVIWDGLEPEPGQFNEAYLRGIDRQIAWARENGLYVFLDMHQDLYSVLFSDGAPAWATLTGDLPHETPGAVWSDAYFTSPAVQSALDHFWENTPAPDGRGLQDHYAQVWQMLARRYAGEPAVIGYDLMNEPFPGSAAAPSQMLLFQQAAELLGELEGGPAPSAEELAMQWMDEAGRFALLERLKGAGDSEHAARFARIVDTTYPLYAAFEHGALMGLYRRVAEAIREVDAGKILMLETSMGSNMGVYSAIQPLEHNGARDPQQAYAPHGYDLVVDTPSIAQASSARVNLIFNRHGETARRQDWPMLVGEWGAYGSAPGTLPAARDVITIFEQLLCSDTYWAYQEDIQDFPCFPALHRPYPQRVSGTLQNYHHDPRTGIFTCDWLEDPVVLADTILYLPAWMGFTPGAMTLTPPGAYHVEEEDHGQPPTGIYLHITPSGQSVPRSFKLAAAGR